MDRCQLDTAFDLSTLPVSTSVNELNLDLNGLQRDLSILNHFPNVQSLKLFRVPIMPFSYNPLNIKRLKTFSFRSRDMADSIYFDPVFNILAECNNLNRLNLEVIDWDDFVSFRNVLKITNLKQLQIRFFRAPGSQNDLEQNSCEQPETIGSILHRIREFY